MKACAPASPRKSGTASAGSCPLFLMTVLKSVCCAASTASVAVAAPIIQTIRFILIPQFESQFDFCLSAWKGWRQRRQLRVLDCARRRKVHSLDAAALRDLHIRDRSVAVNGEGHHNERRGRRPAHVGGLPVARDVLADHVGISSELLAEGRTVADPDTAAALHLVLR